jgi:hypothetical protein
MVMPHQCKITSTKPLTPCCCCCCRDWNPAVDKHLPVKYDVSSFKAGKAACKKALQEELGLPVDANIPLVAFIGRLDYQKGADIVLQVGVGAETCSIREQWTWYAAAAVI